MTSWYCMASCVSLGRTTVCCLLLSVAPSVRYGRRREKRKLFARPVRTTVVDSCWWWRGGRHPRRGACYLATCSREKTILNTRLDDFHRKSSFFFFFLYCRITFSYWFSAVCRRVSRTSRNDDKREGSRGRTSLSVPTVGRCDDDDDDTCTVRVFVRRRRGKNIATMVSKRDARGNRRRIRLTAGPTGPPPLAIGFLPPPVGPVSVARLREHDWPVRGDAASARSYSFVNVIIIIIIIFDFIFSVVRA